MEAFISSLSLLSVGEPMSDASKRIPTFVNWLDQRMQGGIPQGHIVLLAGVSGSMKSSLGFSMLYNAVERASQWNLCHNGTREIFSQGHMANMGMDIEDPKVRSSIAIIDLADLRVQLDKKKMLDSEVDWMGQLIRQ